MLIHDEVCSQEFEDVFEDSDSESSDSISYTKMRIKNKKERFNKRCEVKEIIVPLHERPLNASVISKFREFMKNSSFETSKKDNKDLSSLRKKCLDLFEADDSLLSFLTKEDPSFSLSQHLDFGCDQNFRQVTSPMKWLMSVEVAGDSGQENASHR